MFLISLCLLLGTGIAMAQNAPKVTTHGYIARGSTVMLGRSTVSGSNIQEQGFCWSTSPNPTIDDNRSTKYHSHNDRVYMMENLQPSTIYYVRAYAVGKNNTVGYGDVVKVITLPKGNVTWDYDNGADADANARINAAVKDAVDYLNTYTSINGLHTSVHYGSGTPTADCSYGGWMRVGPNASYQRTGTILHELGHAIGVGTHGVWYNADSPMRSGSGRGDWLGERTTEVVRFLENSNSAVLTGDGTHMWPYGVNGAHEDTGSQMLYIGNALIYQALGEDGLPPTGGFATPAYSFEQEDTTKYYIKNESDDFGLSSSYVVVENNKIVWKSMSGADALADDHAAWYVTFDPKNCYYQLRNAATGQYIMHSGNVVDGASDNTNFHIMRSRVDVSVGSSANKFNVRGYWLVKPQHSPTPSCLSAAAGGKVTSAAFDLTDEAHSQRWVFLTCNEIGKFEQAANSAYMIELDEWVERIDIFLRTPHTEKVEGADAALEATLALLKEKQTQSLSVAEIASYIAEAKEKLAEFLPNVTPTEVNCPFDITYMIANAAIDDATGWSDSPTLDYSCMEYYGSASIFDFNQTTTSKMPKGVYQLRVQAFQRPGDAAKTYEEYLDSINRVTAEIYLDTREEQICHIASEARRSKLGGSEVKVVNNDTAYYMPNDLQAASKYFKRKLYDNILTMQLRRVKELKLGIRNGSLGEKYWTVFDNFRLYYFGDLAIEDVQNVVDIQIPEAEQNKIEEVVVGGKSGTVWPIGVYSITGQCVRYNTTSLEGLPAGLYIVEGKKVIVK